jgi:DNA-binding response OmpR family regulator
MASGTRRLLYVDEDAEARLMMRELLAAYELDATGSDEEARVLARRRSYDVYIVTSGGPESAGLALCSWLHRIDPRTPIVYCSSNGTAQHEQRAIAAGALRYHVKPLDPNLLQSTLSLLLKLAEIESRRAWIAQELAIQDELAARSQPVVEAALSARSRAHAAVDSMLRIKAYRAFRDAGGNRANFERMCADTDGADASAA